MTGPAIQYRSFLNTDPPQVLKLWHQCSPGPGAAEGFSCDAFELFVFGRPAFDPRGLLLAWDGDRLVGLCHAAFSASDDESRLDSSRGVINALMVHPEYRRQGIGTELLRQAEGYLLNSGSREIVAGSGLDQAPLYVGIYGGVQPSGFASGIESIPPFFHKNGYTDGRVTTIMQRDLAAGRDPVSARLMRQRRQLNIVITDRMHGRSWWWYQRFGCVEGARIELRQRTTSALMASCEILGMDIYIPKWGVRAVGLRNIVVPSTHRRQGFGLALLLEICRRLRDESISIIEVHVDTENVAGISLLQSALFEPVERMMTFTRNAT